MRSKPTQEELPGSKIENKVKFKHLIKNSFDMLVLLNSNGVQHYVSESCFNILGYQPEELVNIPVIEQMIHPDDKKHTYKALQKLINNSNQGGVQYRHRHKNGGWVYLETFGTNQLNNPSVKSVVLNVRDITKRKNAVRTLQEKEAQLKELIATKDKFFAIISHDLRSPFNNILTCSNLLAEKMHNKDYDEIEELSQIIQQSSQQAMNLVSNLLEWSRTQTGRIKLTPEHFKLETLTDEAIHLLNDSAKHKSIIVSKKLQHNSPIYADKSMISCILRNLLSNAIKFTNIGGQITIRDKQQNNNLIVTISDNGVGLKKEAIDKLFRIEYRQSTKGTKKETGTGLGLLLCKEFIEMHDGKIWATSEPQKGSSFCFQLPLAKQ